MPDHDEQSIPEPETEPVEPVEEPTPDKAPIADIQTPVNDPTGSPFPSSPPQNA